MGGIISGIAGIFGGSAKKKANSKSTAALVNAQNQIQGEVKNNLAATEGYINPYYQAGTSALGQVSKDILNGSLYKPFDNSDLTADDGYQFRLKQGQDALDAQASRAGSVFSGGQLKAASDYNQDAASQEYQNAYNRYNQDQDKQYNELMGLTNIGQNATQQEVSANNNASSALASSIGAIGNAQAQQATNAGNITANQINSGANALTSLASLFI